MNVPLWRFLYPMPIFVFLGLLMVWLRYNDIHLYGNVKLLYLEKMRLSNEDLRPVIILVLTVFLMLFAYYYQFKIHVGTSNSTIEIYGLITIIIIFIVLVMVLAGKMFYISGQKIIMEMQETHINNLQEMTRIIKAQRHDFVNHLQVIYGLVRLQQIEQVETYIAGLYQEVKFTGDMLQLAIPELSAFLLVQTGLAAARDISLEIEQESELSNLKVHPLELIAVVGNLIKNALEAVDELTTAQKTVKVKILERSKYYVIQVKNPGCISPDIKPRIFETGFTTKNDPSERGIGLVSVKYLVEKNRGLILVNSREREGTRFTVCYPKKDVRRVRA